MPLKIASIIILLKDFRILQLGMPTHLFIQLLKLIIRSYTDPPVLVVLLPMFTIMLLNVQCSLSLLTICSNLTQLAVLLEITGSYIMVL